MQKSRVHAIASFAALAALAVVSVSSSAHAASSTTCTGSSALGYSPGLTFTSQTISVSETDTFSSCTSTDSSLTSGSFSATFTVHGVSCDDVEAAGPGADAYEISWNNSQSSTIDATAATVAIVGGNQVFTLVGTVSSGEFTGDDVTVTWVYPLVDVLQCLTSPGITSQSGTVAVEIVGL
jgi:hypothetical protein